MGTLIQDPAKATFVENFVECDLCLGSHQPEEPSQEVRIAAGFSLPYCSVVRVALYYCERGMKMCQNKSNLELKALELVFKHSHLLLLRTLT